MDYTFTLGALLEMGVWSQDKSIKDNQEAKTVETAADSHRGKRTGMPLTTRKRG